MAGKRGRKSRLEMQGEEPSLTRVGRAVIPETPDVVPASIDKIVELWGAGQSLHTITKALKLPITGSALFTIINADAELRGKLNTARETRANTLAERSVDWAEAAAATGDPAGFNVAIKTSMQIAAALDPKRWGPTNKVELSGPNGRPLQLKADMTLSPAEAYERMVTGK